MLLSLSRWVGGGVSLGGGGDEGRDWELCSEASRPVVRGEAGRGGGAAEAGRRW